MTFESNKSIYSALQRSICDHLHFGNFFLARRAKVYRQKAYCIKPYPVTPAFQFSFGAQPPAPSLVRIVRAVPCLCLDQVLTALGQRGIQKREGAGKLWRVSLLLTEPIDLLLKLVQDLAVLVRQTFDLVVVGRVIQRHLQLLCNHLQRLRLAIH